MAYTPAAMLSSSSGLAHLASVFYHRTALKKTFKRFMFWKGVDDRVLPLKNGKLLQMYRYSQLGANTVATTEGAVGTPIEMADSAIVTTTVAQYADFISLSDMLVDTALDGDIVGEASSQLGYRAGLTCDNINKAEIDSVASSMSMDLMGDYFSGADLANFRTRFAGLDIPPPSGGFFPVIAHPYVTYDLIHDPQVGGFKDIVKQTGSIDKFNQEDRGFVCRFNSCEVWESTNVTVTSGTPNTYRIVAFGQEALGAIDLAGRGPSRVQDPEKQNFKLHVSRKEPASIANPEGKIRAFVSYNFVYAVKNLDTNPYRMRKIDAPSSLGI